MRIEFIVGTIAACLAKLRWPARGRRAWWRLPPALALLLAPASTASAQALGGVVVDGTTGRAVEGVQVRLLAIDSTAIGVAAFTDSSGSFTIRPRGADSYRLEVDEIGYARLVTGPIEVGTADTSVKLAIRPEAIVLDSIVVQARGRELYHAATYESLYARHAISHHVGPNRVFVRDDPAFERARDVRDLIRLIRSFTCTPYVYWNGSARGNSANARALIETPTSMLEGVEYFQDITALPFAYSAGAALPSEVRQCGVVALWTRRASK